jgi:ARC6-like, IMS domain
MLTRNTATVVADMVERADAVYRADRQESYEQAVRVEYRLIRSAAGWRISGSRLLDSQAGTAGGGAGAAAS